MDKTPIFDIKPYVVYADACKKDIALAGCEVDFEESFGAVSEIYVTSVGAVGSSLIPFP